MGSILTVLCFYLGCSRFASICCFRAVEEMKLFVYYSMLLLSLRLSIGGVDGVEGAQPRVKDTPHPTRPWPSLTLREADEIVALVDRERLFKRRNKTE